MEGLTVHDVIKTISDTTCLDMFRMHLRTIHFGWQFNDSVKESKKFP